MTKLMEKPVSPQRRDLLVPSVLQRFRHADQRRMVNRINDDVHVFRGSSVANIIQGAMQLGHCPTYEQPVLTIQHSCDLV